MSLSLSSFFTPIARSESPVINFIENYLWFGGKVCHIVFDGPTESVGQVIEEKSSPIATALKILSMVLSLGILAIIALVIKSISRCLSHPIILLPTHLGLNNRADLLPPNPQIEQAQLEQNQFEAPLNAQILLRARSLHTPFPFAIDSSLVLDACRRCLALMQRSTIEEQRYLTICAREDTAALIKFCPAVAEVLDETTRFQPLPLQTLPIVAPIRTAAAAPVLGINPRRSIGDDFAAGIQQRRLAAQRSLPLHLRPGGHVLSGN